jgi:hypothetical protein
MSKPYRPSNGTEGTGFIESFCVRCWHDRNEDCPILAASFIDQVPEWVCEDDGSNAHCTQFKEKEPKEFPEDAKKQLSLFEGGT